MNDYSDSDSNSLSGFVYYVREAVDKMLSLKLDQSDLDGMFFGINTKGKVRKIRLILEKTHKQTRVMNKVKIWERRNKPRRVQSNHYFLIRDVSDVIMSPRFLNMYNEIIYFISESDDLELGFVYNYLKLEDTIPELTRLGLMLTPILQKHIFQSFLMVKGAISLVYLLA